MPGRHINDHQMRLYIADISESRPRYHFLSLRFSCSP